VNVNKGSVLRKGRGNGEEVMTEAWSTGTVKEPSSWIASDRS
jgi:hypothetical protein